MSEILPNEADQSFLYQLICSQLENDGYIKSAKCLQVELNSIESAVPGDKLEKLVKMCIQIKKHIDVHFNNPANKKISRDLGMDPDSTNINSEMAIDEDHQDTVFSGIRLSEVDRPMEEDKDDSCSPHPPVIERSDATSSSEVVASSEIKDEGAKRGSPPPSLNIEGCTQQLIQQQLLLQQIQLQQLHSSSIDEQAKKLNEYMLKCYKKEHSPPVLGQSIPTPRSSIPTPRSSPLYSQSSPSSLITSTAFARPYTPGALSPALSPGESLTRVPVRVSPGDTTTSSPAPPKPAETASPWFHKDVILKPSSKPITDTQDYDRKRFPCRYCGRRFTQQSALQVHERTHTGEKPYHCHYCDKAFTQISNLKCHERLHTGEKPYRCQLCGKRFTQSASLRCHMRSHTGERPYLCKYCNKRFTQPASLQHHIRIHTGEKPYRCEHCGKCFTQPSSLVVHRRLHTGERPFVCQTCGKSYTQAMPLKEHMRTHHRLTEKSPLSFNIGQPFSLQMSQLQNTLASNIGPLPFILSNKFIQDQLNGSSNAVLPNSGENALSSNMSQIFFNRQNTAFQSVFPTLSKGSNSGDKSTAE